MKPRRFVILDRDGTINVEREYLSHPSQLELLPGVVSGLRRFRKLGFGLVVVTNQSGLGRGYFNEAQLALIHQKLAKMLAENGVHLDGLYLCPHRPDENCPCRKPRTALVEKAALEHRFHPSEAFVIGDKLIDIELGKNVGATTLLVRTGYGAQVALTAVPAWDYVVDDLAQAASLIELLMAKKGSK